MIRKSPCQRPDQIALSVAFKQGAPTFGSFRFAKEELT